ncbi:MAG: hypothetical protein ABR915_13235 [Thermoguttaceae bacterium]|jgi:hypothetical protein
MRAKGVWRAAVSIFFLAALAAAWAVFPPRALGNGGPFVVKYPGGDPAAKGVLARLDPSLKPTQETRLRVVNEDLDIHFGTAERGGAGEPPLVGVSAVYTIENPTDQEVHVDFGFPILRGIYLISGMSNHAEVDVMVDKKSVAPMLITNSGIYGMIRQSARQVIEKAIAQDPELTRLVTPVRGAWVLLEPEPAAGSKQTARPNGGEDDLVDGSEPSGWAERRPTAAYLPACDALRSYLTGRLGWNARDAALMVGYASLDIGAVDWSYPPDRWDDRVWNARAFEQLKGANLWALGAIGEQKATQLLAHLASRFGGKAGSTYEATFAAWGGDVRERSLDLVTGQVRPRELSLSPPASGRARFDDRDRRLTADPTVYARIDYLDPDKRLGPAEKASCEAILKNLPVTFTFAPMNLLYYQVKFPAHATRTVAVEYKQYAYADTRGTGSYQLAYVLHPATLWKDFGPIHVKIAAPKGMICRSSVALRRTGEAPAAEEERGGGNSVLRRPLSHVYEATLNAPEEKRGELFVGVDKAAWDAMFPPAKPTPAPAPSPAPAAASKPATSPMVTPRIIIQEEEEEKLGVRP